MRPSRIDSADTPPDCMAVADLATGNKFGYQWKPSSDTPTHLGLCRAFGYIDGIAYAQSTNAVAFAQAGMSIPAKGAANAGCFHGDVPPARGLSCEEVENGHEINTGKVIIETIRESGYNMKDNAGIIAKSHGPFFWGKDVADWVNKVVVMGEVADMSIKTLMLNSDSYRARYVLDKHCFRKHGARACCG